MMPTYRLTSRQVGILAGGFAANAGYSNAVATTTYRSAITNTWTGQ